MSSSNEDCGELWRRYICAKSRDVCIDNTSHNIQVIACLMRTGQKKKVENHVKYSNPYPLTDDDAYDTGLLKKTQEDDRVIK